MKETKICPQCNEEYTPRRSDAIFCSDTCRWKNWNEKREQKSESLSLPVQKPNPVSIPPVNLHNTLRGILGSEELETPELGLPEKKLESEDLTIKPIEVETAAYREQKARVQALITFNKRLSGDINACDAAIGNLKRDQGGIFPFATLLTGLYLGNSKGDKKAIPMILSGAIGWGIGKLADTHLLKEYREAERKKNLTLALKKKSELMRQYEEITKQMRFQFAILCTIPKLEIKHITYQKDKPEATLSGLLVPGQKQDLLLPKQTDKQETAKIIPEKEPPAIQTDEKLINSKQLIEMNYKCLNYRGKWLDFFGQPSIVFHLVVHGKSGEGKSTFCIQFANYLAENFGTVVYISGEEGFSKTLRDKVISAGVETSNLFFADLSSFDEIKSRIEADKFHFIFIDSLDTLKIDAARLRELRERYGNSAFITISQSTKDGKMRGSNEIVHDSDIAVVVEKGIATTTKNRFKERDKEFRVFPEESSSGVKVISLPRNVI
jgi:hypothetical protein